MRRIALVLIAGLASVPVLAQLAYSPGPHNVALPADYQSRFIRYATVDRPERRIVRYLYVNPEALAAARPGQPLPDGTVLIMEDHAVHVGPDGAPLLDQQGRLIPQPAVAGLFVQERRPGWGVGYPPEMRNGEWEYARFNPDGSRHPGPLQACFTCHLTTRASQDFAFNFWDYVQVRR